MATQHEPPISDLELSSQHDTDYESECLALGTPTPAEDAIRPNILTTWPSHAISLEDVPPDGGFGWVVAFVFSSSTPTPGGASQLEYALIGGLSISQSLLISPLVAVSNRKLGTKPTLVIGAFLVSAAWLGASFATQIWHLFLTVGCCFGFGMGFLYVTAAAVLPQWFLRRRSLAVGLATSGAGLGGLAYNLGAGAAIESLGLQWTYRVLAISSFVCNFACALVLKDRNKLVKPNQRSFDHKELGKLEVNLVIAWGFLTELGYIVLLYSLPHYASSIGLTTKQGSIIGAMLNLGLGVGRPFVGYFSDSWGRINTAAGATGLCGVFCLAIWLPAKSYGVLLLFALLAGTVVGTFWGTVTAVTTEVVGLRRLPSTFGIICMALVLPTTFAEPLGLQIVSGAGYATSQAFVGLVFLLASACVWLLRSWKITQLEMKAQLHSGHPVQGSSLQLFKPSKLFSLRRV